MPEEFQVLRGLGMKATNSIAYGYTLCFPCPPYNYILPLLRYSHVSHCIWCPLVCSAMTY